MVAQYTPYPQQRPPWLQPQAAPYQQPQYLQWQQPGMATPWQQAQARQQPQMTPAATPDLWQQAAPAPAWQSAQPQQQAAPATPAPQWSVQGTPEWASAKATVPGYTPPMYYQKQAPGQDAAPGEEAALGTGPTTAENTGKPSWTTQTAGFDGNTYYGVLNGKFDPWGSWGKYGPAQNGQQKHAIAGGDGYESDVDRVYRWTNDILRGMGYAGGENAPPALRTQIFLANVERLKSEYAARKADWNTSDFANMDRQIRAAVAAPSTGLNNGQTTPPAAATPATAAPNVGGTGPAQLRNFGQFQTDDLAALLQAAANDPDRAAQILRLARGETGRPLGRMADFRDALYGRSFQTALSLAGMDGMGTMEGMAGDFLNNAVLGNNLAGYAGGLGRQVAGMDWEGVDSATMERALRAGLALQGINMGAMGGSIQQGRLEDIVWDDWARSLGNTQNDTRNFSDLLANSPFIRAMQAFGR